MAASKEKRAETRPFLLYFLLPVGLADFITNMIMSVLHLGQHGFVTGAGKTLHRVQSFSFGRFIQNQCADIRALASVLTAKVCAP